MQFLSLFDSRYHPNYGPRVFLDSTTFSLQKPFQFNNTHKLEYKGLEVGVDFSKHRNLETPRNPRKFPVSRIRNFLHDSKFSIPG